MLEEAAFARPLSFYLIEDDDVCVLMLESIIQELGYELMGHSDQFEQALRFFDTQLPDLILIDIYIDGAKNGVELAEAIRAKGIRVPLVFVTAASDNWLIDNVLQKARPLEPVGCIRKPISASKLKRELQALLPLEAQALSSQRSLLT